MKSLNRIFGWLVALALLVWRLTCRFKVLNDPRPALRRAGSTYIYALLHAHQVAAVFVNDDRLMTAMVSRSADGDLLVPSLRLRRVIPVRGSSSSRGRDKGGFDALELMKQHLSRGVPALLAVDGPNGPRNRVSRGVARLSLETSTPVLPVAVLPSRRWILARSWDRFQIPKPFCTIRLIFGTPLRPEAYADAQAMRRAISEALDALEATHDPEESPSRAESERSRESYEAGEGPSADLRA